MFVAATAAHFVNEKYNNVFVVYVFGVGGLLFQSQWEFWSLLNQQQKVSHNSHITMHTN